MIGNDGSELQTENNGFKRQIEGNDSERLIANDGSECLNMERMTQNALTVVLNA